MPTNFGSYLKSFARRTLGFAFCLGLSSPGFASPEQVEKVEMAQCHLDFCVQLKTEKLFKSALARTYAFGPSKVQVTEKGQSTFAMDELEGSFDAGVGRFYLSNPKLSYDLVIDTQEHKIYRLPRS